jgi:hypothetical protein
LHQLKTFKALAAMPGMKSIRHLAVAYDELGGFIDEEPETVVALTTIFPDLETFDMIDIDQGLTSIAQDGRMDGSIEIKVWEDDETLEEDVHWEELYSVEKAMGKLEAHWEAQGEEFPENMQPRYRTAGIYRGGIFLE